LGGSNIVTLPGPRSIMLTPLQSAELCLLFAIGNPPRLSSGQDIVVPKSSRHRGHENVGPAGSTDFVVFCSDYLLQPPAASRRPWRTSARRGLLQQHRNRSAGAESSLNHRKSVQGSGSSSSGGQRCHLRAPVSLVENLTLQGDKLVLGIEP
jgi:hypothetical protein